MGEILEKTKNFRFNDFTKSNTANQLGIENTPNKIESENISDTMLIMQKIRDKFGYPIEIESGFRCEKLNKAVKGAKGSAHLSGLAADFYPTDRSRMLELQKIAIKMVEDKEIIVDQLIIEKPNSKGVATWLHIGIKHPTSGDKRQQVFTIK